MALSSPQNSSAILVDGTCPGSRAPLCCLLGSGFGNSRVYFSCKPVGSSCSREILCFPIEQEALHPLHAAWWRRVPPAVGERLQTELGKGGPPSKPACWGFGACVASWLSLAVEGKVESNFDLKAQTGPALALSRKPHELSVLSVLVALRHTAPFCPLYMTWSRKVKGGCPYLFLLF